MSPVRVVARDGFPLGGSLFAPSVAVPPRAACVVASAMGVPRRLYDGIAAYLASRGVATLTFDYRGIGESKPGPLRGFEATLDDWATNDLAGALDECARRFPGLPAAFIGHSLGGQILGLVPDDARRSLRAALLVASQSGWWGHWPGPRRAAMLAIWGALIPVATRLAGYTPFSWFGGGEDVPRGVGLQWAEWGIRRGYVLTSAASENGERFARLGIPIRGVAIGDDRFYAPREAVQALLSYYRGARTERVDLEPSALGVRRIGHFGWLKPAFRESIWSPAADWLEARLAEPARAAG